MRAIVFFDGAHGRLAVYDESSGVREIVTTHALPSQRIRIDDGRTYPFMCVGGTRSGRVLVWSSTSKDMGSNLARDCGARLYKKREGYEGAVERMRADAIIA